MRSFNTLYVVGSKDKDVFFKTVANEFQYIICCWFNISFVATFVLFIIVSIHYMLLVQQEKIELLKYHFP